MPDIQKTQPHSNHHKKTSSGFRSISNPDSRQPKIIFEDNSLLVIDKPSGLVVNRAESVKTLTVQDWIKDNFEFRVSNFELPTDFTSRSGIVHRIDKDTSGLLVIAKTPEAFTNLQAQFKHRQVKKTYFALVHGLVEPEEGTISVPVGRQTFNRHRFGIIPGGRPSVTKYQVVNYYFSTERSRSANDNLSSRLRLRSAKNFNATLNNINSFTLLKLFPQTGRTHQLRVHLKYLGHPIVSDPLYVGRKALKRDLKWCPHLFLHATELEFFHPVNHLPVKFSSNLPPCLSQLIS